MKIRIDLFKWTFILIISTQVFGQKTSLDFNNQASAWIGMNYTDEVFYQTGARYIPTLSPVWNTRNNNKVDAELSVNTYGNLFFNKSGYDTAIYDFKPYRLWLRYSTSNLEIRAGLQKINFGSSNIFRPLMWFDRMDFRDPLQLTDGVYGLLGRYYFNNNANIWLWTLYGNKDVKGWESAPSVPTIPEYGGRAQIPVPKGELAMSYHHRVADYSEFYSNNPMVTYTHFNENLLAVDGKWDLGVGVWFEYVFKINDEDNQILSRYETYYSLGADYTFNIGNGLNLITEFFHYSNSTDDDQQKKKSNFSSMSLNYPFTLSHTLSCFVNYNWDNHEWYRYLNLQLKYDYLSLYIMAFWNPDKFSLFTGSDDSNSFAGKGFQIMIVLDI
jgi:hypothetical protein